MEEKHSSVNNEPVTIRNEHVSSAFYIMVVILLLVVSASAFFLSRYRPAPSQPQPQVTFEQKMAHLETGAPLPAQENRPVVPRWMMAMIFGFVVIQILPLVWASFMARSKEFTRRDLRAIEYLAETPLYLGLLGSLLGVCMTHFLSGNLSAPLAYLTTISGILMYLFGRFTILVSLPSSNDFT